MAIVSIREWSNEDNEVTGNEVLLLLLLLEDSCQTKIDDKFQGSSCGQMVQMTVSIKRLCIKENGAKAFCKYTLPSFMWLERSSTFGLTIHIVRLYFNGNTIQVVF